MNIDYANTIALSKVLSKIGIEPTKAHKHQVFYPSFLVKDAPLALVVDTTTNSWQDYYAERGGNVVTLVCAYLESVGATAMVHDALRWLDTMLADQPMIEPVPFADYSEQNEKFIVTDVWPLMDKMLVRYIEQRGIPPHLAKIHLQQATAFNRASEMSFPVLSFKNEDGGYELRNAFFKGASRKQAITFIRGLIPKPDGFHIFHSIFDYLSILAQRNGKAFNDDVIILNCVGNLRDAAAYIKHYGYRQAYLWLDNNKTGKAAAKSFATFFATEPGLQYSRMNKTYDGFKDVNDWHMHKLGLQGI